MFRRLTALVVFLVLLAFPAEAAKRVALVIGNNAYANQEEKAQLKKAVNDAAAVRDTLKGLGFEITYRENATLGDFKSAVFEFSRKIKKDDIAVFFYAGHGAALKGTNYFLPSDIPKLELPDSPSEQEIETKVAELAEFSVREAFVLEQISKNEPKVSLLIMDACRDNPLRDDSGDNPFRSFSRGGIALGDNISTAEKAQPEGMIIVYSASFGQRALDRLSATEADPNSPFTRSFLKNLNQPGMGLKQVVAATKEEVFKLAKSINETQTPAVYDQLFGGDVFLSGAAAPSIKPIVDDIDERAKQAFEAAKDDQNVLRIVADEFADTSWGMMAAARLKTLEENKKIAETSNEKGSLDLGALNGNTNVPAPKSPSDLAATATAESVVIEPVSPLPDQTWAKILALSLKPQDKKPKSAIEGTEPLPIPPPPAESSRTIRLTADGTGDYKTLAEAIKAAESGGIIELEAGKYEGGISVDFPLELRGKGGVGQVVISHSGGHVISWNAANGSIRNVTIKQESGCGKNSCSAIFFRSGSARIEDNYISSAGGSAVLIVGHNAAPQITSNKIYKSARHGIEVIENGKGSLSKNEIFLNSNDGVMVSTDGYVKMFGNTVRENRWNGVKITSGGEVYLENSQILSNGQNGLLIDEKTKVMIYSSAIAGNQRNGIYMSGDSVQTIRGSEIYNNKHSGIYVREGANPTVENSRINRNKYQAINIAQGSGGQFLDNDLRNNGLGAWSISALSTLAIVRENNKE